MTDTNSQIAIKIIAYATGAIASLAVLGLALYKVAVNDVSPMWWSIITTIISLYIPSPLQLTNLFQKSTATTALQELKNIT